jgi:hypothetical protein
VPLLARRLEIALQDLINKGDHGLQLRVRPFGLFTRLGQGAANRLPHHASVYLDLPGHPGNRPHPKLILASNLFK